MFYYAQIDINNLVIGVSALSEKVISTDMISLPSYDTSLLGKTYDIVNKIFI